MDRALGGPFGSERFSKDERFFLMLGGQSTVYTLHIVLLGGSVYKRPQRPFKNASFATRGFTTLFSLKRNTVGSILILKIVVSWYLDINDRRDTISGSLGACGGHKY